MLFTLQFPNQVGIGNIPIFPRYRVDADEVCDSTITSIFGNQVYYRKDIKIYPNPATDVINIELPHNFNRGHWVIYDMKGALVLEGKVDGLNQILTVDVSSLNSGSYSFELLLKDNLERVIYTSKVVVQK